MFHRVLLSEPSEPIDDITVETVDVLFDDVAGHLNAQHGRLIDLTVWLLANKRAWQGDGVWTPAQYLAWRAGVSPNTAGNIVAAAERAGDLPSAMDAIRCGELSLDQLMPIVRRVPAWADGQVVSLAARLTVHQIYRVDPRDRFRLAARDCRRSCRFGQRCRRRVRRRGGVGLGRVGRDGRRRVCVRG